MVFQLAICILLIIMSQMHCLLALAPLGHQSNWQPAPLRLTKILLNKGATVAHMMIHSCTGHYNKSSRIPTAAIIYHEYHFIIIQTSNQE
jgi:hypothetical protein